MLPKKIKWGPKGPIRLKGDLKIMLIISITLIIIIIAMLWDLRTRKIPNIITLPIIFIGIIINFFNNGFTGIGNSLLGLVIGIMLLLLPFIMKGIGAGDVKLLGAIGALNGVGFVFNTFLYSAIAGGILAIIYAFYKGYLRTLTTKLFSFIIGFITKTTNKETIKMMNERSLKFPYGIALFFGTITAYLVR